MKRKRRTWRTSRDDFITRIRGYSRNMPIRGFEVRLPRKHKLPLAYFGLREWGSERRALEAARAHRDRLFAATGEAPRRTGKVRRTAPYTVTRRRDNKTGIPGVSTDGKHWFAYYHPRPGVQKRRTYSIKLYTDAGARMLAIAWRNKMIAKLRSRT